MYNKINFFILKNIAFLVLFIFICNTAHSHSITKTEILNYTQQKTIRGIIIDESGVPLPGATIVLKGTTNGVSSNFDGEFSIEAELGETLKISFLGYETKEVLIDSDYISITLKTNNSLLDEVLIVGYGKQNKKDLTGAVSQLSENNFKKGVNVSPDNLLQGKVAGVRIVQSSGEPGAGVDVSIRGIGSIRSGSTPLFVVDGIPLSNSNVSSASPNFGLGSSSAKNPLNFLNTSDIESITVLKDASAAAIYGARGSNGVVIITTKQGKTGDASITMDSYLSIANVIKKWMYYLLVNIAMLLPMIIMITVVIQIGKMKYLERQLHKIIIFLLLKKQIAETTMLLYRLWIKKVLLNLVDLKEQQHV